MKIVLADDFTGAAEMAGIGLRCGFQVEVRRDLQLSGNPSLLVLDLDTRSRTAREARQRLQQIVVLLQEHPPAFLYKKTDSVLRGHVRLELESLMTGLGYPVSILVPANPSRHRIIRHGVYYIEGRPLSETDLGVGRSLPSRTGNVLELLSPEGNLPVRLARPEEELPGQGMVVGEAWEQSHLQQWAKKVGPQVLPAGGSDFFLALLQQQGCQVSTRPLPVNEDVFSEERMLFVLGSRSSYSRNFVHHLEDRAVPLCFFPAPLASPQAFREENLERWVENVVLAFHQSRKVVAAGGTEVIADGTVSRNLAQFSAVLVEKVLQAIPLDELVIEGGATASAILNRLQWNCFRPLQELDTGVVQLKAEQKDRPRLIVKPGSYPWPPCLWAENNEQSSLQP